MTGQLPDFLGIGVQKGGTTSLQRLLEQHPQVFLPSCKQVHYFSLHDEEPLGWYPEHYATAGAGQLRGENILFCVFNPRARMIVLLRNPVDRALSQYFHARLHGFELLELKVATARMAAPGSRDYSHRKHRYVIRSRYELQLAGYEALFPRRQLLVLRNEDLVGATFGATKACWERIQALLGLDSIPLPTPGARQCGPRRSRHRACSSTHPAAARARHHHLRHGRALLHPLELMHCSKRPFSATQ